MKQIFIIVIACAMLTGCGKKCDDYASNDAIISWTGYNSIQSMIDYFGCHPKTIKMHIGDTIRICGYANRRYDDVRVGSPFVYLSDTESENSRVILVEFLPSSADLTSMSEMAKQDGKLYVTGTIHSFKFDGEIGCCSEEVTLWPIDIDTIPQNYLN